MNVILFLGVYFLGKGINISYHKKQSNEKAYTYITIGLTIIVIITLDKIGFFDNIYGFLQKIF